MVQTAGSAFRWHQFTSCVFTLFLCSLVFASISSTSAQPPYPHRGVCSYPPHMMGPAAQRICKFIEEYQNLGELTEALEQFLDAKVERSVVPLNDPEVKRQDLDHVFLRFGRDPRTA
ncbi:hypothetical protein FHG87_001489 [Trinorchestia longiramus]|nr:hypothetical protein FHG87_001489 [Trinorchestia longiramus]